MYRLENEHESARGRGEKVVDEKRHDQNPSSMCPISRNARFAAATARATSVRSSGALFMRSHVALHRGAVSRPYAP
jgi:hypothetical protein